MKLSLQLFTVRDAMAASPEETLGRLAEIGLQFVEPAGTYGMTGEQFRAMLDRHGLRASGMHVGLDQLEQYLSAVVDAAQALDTEWVIVPYLPENRRTWPEVAGTLNNIGGRLQANGLKLAYHNHDFEFRDGGLEVLLQQTNPEVVYFELDLGWIQFAGKSPVDTLNAFGHRAPLVHLKDMLPGAENPHVVAGHGTVDWIQVLAACKARDVEFGVIEMDHPPNDPVEDVSACFRFFKASITEVH